MSCPFYWYNYHYACRKSEKDVNEDVYYKYCRDYDYEDCPIYKQEGNSSGCFLTSACVEAKGLPDDCKELTVLRAFRDGYMKSLPQGQADICEYYHIAPPIVAKIHELPNAKEIFGQLYEGLIAPCVLLIQNGYNHAAYSLYKGTIREMEEKYL